MLELLLPVVDDDGAPFWEYAARGELRVQACAATAAGCASRPGPAARTAGPSTASGGAMSGRGRIWSYVVPHPPLLPAYAAQAPYNAIVVELADAPHIRLVGNLVTAADAPLELRRPGAAADRRRGEGACSAWRRCRRAALAAGAAVTCTEPTRDGVAVVTLDRPERHNAIDLDDRRRTRRRLAGVPVRRRRAGRRPHRRGRPGLLHRHRPHRRRPAALLPVHDRRSAARDRPQGQRPVEAGHRRRQGDGLRRGLLPPRRGGVRRRRRARHLLRPAHDLRHGQRLRGDPHGAADALRGGRPDVPDGHRRADAAPRAYETGLVSEVGARRRCSRRRCARRPSSPSYPTEAVQGTVRAVWSAKEAARAQALAQAPHLIALGNLPPERQAELFSGRGRGSGSSGCGEARPELPVAVSRNPCRCGQ